MLPWKSLAVLLAMLPLMFLLFHTSSELLNISKSEKGTIQSKQIFRNQGNIKFMTQLTILISKKYSCLQNVRFRFCSEQSIVSTEETTRKVT